LQLRNELNKLVFHYTRLERLAKDKTLLLIALIAKLLRKYCCNYGFCDHINNTILFAAYELSQ
jgi:hypothetical protein